jgi:hypothetical protein
MRVKNEDTHVSHEQAEAQAQDVDAPHPSPQVVERRNSLYFKLIHKISSYGVLQRV